MAAVTQYLWEEYLRNSEVGQAAIIQAEKEEQEHKILVQENEETNKVLIFYLIFDDYLIRFILIVSW